MGGIVSHRGNTYVLHNCCTMLKSLVLVLMLSTAYAQRYAETEYSAPRLNFGSIETEKMSFTDNVREFLSLDDVGQTTLGRIFAWKGDLIQPLSLFGLSLFAVYTFLRILLT